MARLGLGDDFPAAIALTRELFGDFIIQISADPEINNCSYVTFNVQTRESVESALERECEWFRRVRWPTEAEGGFCLNVILTNETGTNCSFWRISYYRSVLKRPSEPW